MFLYISVSINEMLKQNMELRKTNIMKCEDSATKKSTSRDLNVQVRIIDVISHNYINAGVLKKKESHG